MEEEKPHPPDGPPAVPRRYYAGRHKGAKHPDHAQQTLPALQPRWGQTSMATLLIHGRHIYRRTHLTGTRGTAVYWYNSRIWKAAAVLWLQRGRLYHRPECTNAQVCTACRDCAHKARSPVFTKPTRGCRAGSLQGTRAGAVLVDMCGIGAFYSVRRMKRYS